MIETITIKTSIYNHRILIYSIHTILSILKSIELGFKKILYIDIDAHHCDAVQDNFLNYENVQIISIHENNKWPRTGKLEESKIPNIINIPVPEKFNDSEMLYVINNLIVPYCTNYSPDLTIIQAGADCLEDDPQSKMSLTNTSYWKSISKLSYFLLMAYQLVKSSCSRN